MTTETMNVHQALAELKTLESRINKKLREGGPYVIANRHNNTKIDGEPLSNYIEAAKDAYQAVQDLINRRNALKRAVVQSNANTAVTIGGITYTVAEAIDTKDHGIPMLRSVLNTLTHQYNSAKETCQINNGERLERRADEHIKVVYGENSAKNATEEILRTRKEFIDQQTMEIVDPLGNIRDEIARLENEISTFETSVDAALSTSNATTMIEFSY